MGIRVCEPFLPNFPIPPSNIYFFLFTLTVKKNGFLEYHLLATCVILSTFTSLSLRFFICKVE